MKKVFSAVLLAGALLASPAHTQQAQGGHDAHHPDAALADGEVRKVDKDAKKITIKHGPLANLDMPPMTMVFQVKDPALLGSVKTGDRIRFAADKVGGAYTVTRIEPAK
ncbi:MAG TPA: copper-binding protein [Steroidobacteraceae bacterium]|nr:copper-binding protein [Steroidobacteraceae bacterium]